MRNLYLTIAQHVEKIELSPSKLSYPAMLSKTSVVNLVQLDELCH